MTGCDAVAPHLEEFALGLLVGAERAEVVAHLAGCAACRAEVAAASATLDRLLPAAPAADPPAGFEAAVLVRLAEAGALAEPAPAAPMPAPAVPLRRAMRWGRRLLVAAAVVVLVVGALAVGRASTPPAAAAARSGPMEATHAGRTYEVGRAIVGEDPDLVVVAVPGWRLPGDRGQAYRLRLTVDGGGVRTVGPVQLRRGYWAASIPVAGDRVQRVAIVDGDGHVTCSARLRR